MKLDKTTFVGLFMLLEEEFSQTTIEDSYKGDNATVETPRLRPRSWCTFLMRFQRYM